MTRNQKTKTRCLLIYSPGRFDTEVWAWGAGRGVETDNSLPSPTYKRQKTQSLSILLDRHSSSQTTFKQFQINYTDHTGYNSDNIQTVSN